MVDGVYTEDKKTGEMVYAERSPEELKKLEDLVKSAVGYDEKRGDNIKVTSLKFSSDFGGAPKKEGALSFIKDDFQSVIQILVMGLVAMMVILMVIRPLVKRALEASSAQQTITVDNGVPLLGVNNVQAIAGPGGAAAITGGISAGGGMGEDEGFSSISDIRGPSKSASLKKINELLDGNPEEAVSLIRGWLYGENAA